MSLYDEENKKFESSMSAEIQDVEYDHDLEMYTNETTQLCWLVWLIAREV
ncbi:MAG: hypothetical protein RR231_12630 [Acinetobacter sp.]